MFFDNSSPWKELDFPPLLTSKSTQTRPQVFYVNGSIVCNFVALLTSSVQYGNASWLWCDFSQWETETYFEWIIMSLCLVNWLNSPPLTRASSLFFLKLFWGLPVNKCEDQRCLNASLEIILSGTVIGATESLNVQTDLTKQAAQIVRDSQPS